MSESSSQSTSPFWASFTIGGHQYTAKEGDIVEVDFQGGGPDGKKKFKDMLHGSPEDLTPVDTTLSIDDVHVIRSGSKVHLAPELSGAKVEAKLLSHLRNPKIIVFKKKRRKKYRKMNGHKQPITQIQITKIALP